MPAYLDHAASTPMYPAAVEAMLPYLTDVAANPSGAHRGARAARKAIDEARDQMAEVLGVGAGDIVFTSGGTEADNLAVLGGHSATNGTVVCSAIEHPAVLEPTRGLAGRLVGVDSHGVVDLDQLADLLDETVGVVSVMTVNNEVGTIQPMTRVAAVVRELAPRAVLHTDAVQAFCWRDLRDLGPLVDSLSLSAHKFGGPKGVGVAVMRNNVTIDPRQFGGGQERERRSGTHNVAGIVAMATAARLTDDHRVADNERIGKLRDRLVDGLSASIDGIVETGVIDGDRAHKVVGNAHLCILGIEAEALLFLLDDAGLAASAASSCASGAQDPSHVLAAMGVPREVAAGSLRLTLGATTTDTEIDRALEVVPEAVSRLRRSGS